MLHSSVAAYKNFILVFGGSDEDDPGVVWYNVDTNSYTMSTLGQTRGHRKSSGIAYVEMFYGSPAFMDMFGVKKDGGWDPAPDGELNFVGDSDFTGSSHLLPNLGQEDADGDIVRAALARLADDVIVTTVEPLSGQTWIWDYQKSQLVEVAATAEEVFHADDFIFSGRFLPTCTRTNTKFTKGYESCLAGYNYGGLFGPKNTQPVTIKDGSGTEKSCTFENLSEETDACPKGWFGSADTDKCYKVRHEQLPNDEAALRCNQEGAELLQIDLADEDNYVISILEGSENYSMPVNLGYYHLGIYQRQATNQYYHRNGAKVKYSRSLHLLTLVRPSASECLVYAPIQETHTYKYYWKDVPCNTKAPFICEHNPDFLGFHKLSNLELDVMVDMTSASNSLSTCLATCHAQDQVHVAFIFEERCICARTGAKYKKPIFTLKNIESGLYLTAIGVDQDIKAMVSSGASDQQWIWTNSALESVANPGNVISLAEYSQTLQLKAVDEASRLQKITYIKGQLASFELKDKSFYVNGESVLIAPSKQAHQWKMEQVGTDSTAVDFNAIPVAQKSLTHAWPFDCDEIITCPDIAHQTCACKATYEEGTLENRGLVYNIESSSRTASDLDYQSCEELKTNGVSIRGNFKIQGSNAYCESWSKCVSNVF